MINQGGFIKVTASINLLTEVVAGPTTRPPLTKAGHRPARLRGHFKRLRLILFLVVSQFALIISQSLASRRMPWRLQETLTIFRIINRYFIENHTQSSFPLATTIRTSYS